MYLLHPFVLYAASPALRGLPFVAGYLAFTLACFTVAALSHALIEDPAGRWIRRQFLSRANRSGDPIADAVDGFDNVRPAPAFANTAHRPSWHQ